ncbi:helix-turn-helix transcriptional regulator [Halioxenophilus aromaticivorans]|uniref:HTH araC/xylS-type domain-containing protein n=1 Tax=Halioxenophilus aromaticivorans TaxID=1306992 RepID=A0AAV3U7D5_9ALTE
MSSWKLSTDSCPEFERSAAWQNALTRLCLPDCSFTQHDHDFRGNVSSINSPQGIEFSIITGSPMEIAGKCSELPYSFWLALLLEGDFSLKYKGMEYPARENSIIYAPTGLDMTLSVQSDFKILYMNVPKGLIHKRLLNLDTINVGYLPCESGLNNVFACMLGALSDNIECLESEALRPVEIALTEFLISNLIHQSGVLDFGSTAKIDQFKRICHLIDANLSDPDLSLNLVAVKNKVSARYIQKLFESSGTSFVSYVRSRRLERCRYELSHPEYQHLSVSDICFRWGFNDAGHFSRVFRSEFNTTPRNYRREHCAALQVG